MTVQDPPININDRIEELKIEYDEFTTDAGGSISSSISGEIDGLRWVKELIEESEEIR